MSIDLHYVDVVAGCTRWFLIVPGSGLLDCSWVWPPGLFLGLASSIVPGSGLLDCYCVCPPQLFLDLASLEELMRSG
ncbi:hypothetical protein AVEN_55564-1 [Araneus ventricosus]|uniref:Uncharacterized protein n=1 Tax=Araneus ventricosus TaxID=182803 RepID=A0A4Y2FZJ5_ARAVE|nr:hypothetical protein AVEN_55564-1 [Araneus ventricosus]